jgi:hypothetical protein
MPAMIDPEESPIILTVKCSQIGELKYNQDTGKIKFKSQNIEGIKMNYDPNDNILSIDYG